uniref:Ribosomal RNA-processing protein 14/surfeit locus protein 6 C-terminal domain-containing protein n=1 Tax=Panagrolaimus sp. JU765 TaxID=591449 RepID=A0AC34QUC4_9BILA
MPDDEMKKVDKKPEIETDFDFSLLVSAKDLENEPKKKRKSKKERQNTFKGRDYKRLIQKVEERNQKIESLEEKDPARAKSLKEEIQWNRIMKRAAGEKVKDNVQLLKKGLKKKEKKKVKTKKTWEGRIAKVEENKNKRQEKRKENILKVKTKKKEKKIQKAKKRGRVVIKF